MPQDKFYYDTFNNKKIVCYFSEPCLASSSKKLVVMSHGFRSSSLGPARTFVDFARILNNSGYYVFRYDQPNSGNSQGNYIESSFNEWVNTLIYFAKKFISENYQLAFLGQSMGATTSTVAAVSKELQNKVNCLLLWVPGVCIPDLKEIHIPDKIYEEEGQQYKGSFWIEAEKANFLSCLIKFNSGIHLVYGEYDRYIKKQDRDRVITIVRKKNQKVMILRDNNHSPWKWNDAQKVYKDELEILQKYFPIIQ